MARHGKILLLLDTVIIRRLEQIVRTKSRETLNQLILIRLVESYSKVMSELTLDQKKIYLHILLLLCNAPFNKATAFIRCLVQKCKKLFGCGKI